MPSNVEIKARVRDPKALHGKAAKLATEASDVLLQTDTFFNVPQGRLKVREFVDGHGELVYYSRGDVAGPKVSDYRLAPTEFPAELREALTAALGVRGIVKKRRTLYLVGQTRVHVDEVEGLGDFMELEVVLREGQSAAEGEQIARSLMRELGIEEADLVTGAYVEL
jgi:adenylate cyclase class IV